MFLLMSARRVVATGSARRGLQIKRLVWINNVIQP